MKLLPKCARGRDRCHHRHLAQHVGEVPGEGSMQAAKRREQPMSTRGQQRTSKDHGFAHRWRRPDQESEASPKAYRTGQTRARTNLSHRVCFKSPGECKRSGFYLAYPHPGCRAGRLIRAHSLGA